MASIIPGYEYDIFISYRQKDNKHDGWVTAFVDNLKGELESTFKNDISLYFDINPHNGLLETHDVDASLKDKLKCLIFIPIISRTYCDPKSFAWEHEFKAFIEQASQDQFGLKVKLPNGNVASRVLPVRIHDLDNEDIKLCESVLGGVLRGVEFIYKESGVNRPLMSIEDHPDNNLNKTFYRNQINKVANAIKEILSGLENRDQKGKIFSTGTSEFRPSLRKNMNKKIIFGSLLLLVLLSLGYLVVPKLIRPKGQIEKSIAVLPFVNDSPDRDNEYFCNGMMEEILNNLQKIVDLRVKARSSVERFRNPDKDIKEIGSELHVSYILEGSVRKSGDNLRISVQLIDTKTGDHLWSEIYDGSYTDKIFLFQSSVAKKVAASMKAVISPMEQRRIDVKPTVDIRAHDLDMRANEMIRTWRYTGDSINLRLAFNLLNQALKVDPGYVIAIGSKCNIFSEIGQYDSASYCIERIRAIDPENVDIYGHKGLLYFYSNNLDSALKYYLKFDELRPNDIWTNLALGQIFFFQKYEIVKGLSYFQKSIDMGGDSEPEIDQNISYAYHNLDLYSKAGKYLKTALSIRSECQLIRIYFNIILNKGDFNEPLNFLDSICDITPCEQNCELMRFIIYTTNKEFDKAEEYYDKLLDAVYKRTDKVDFYFNERANETDLYISYLYSETGRKKESLSILNKFIERDINALAHNKNLWAYEHSYIKMQLAAAYAILGDNKNALYYLTEVEKDFPFEWPFKISSFPGFDKLRNDPQFITILKHIEDKKAAVRSQITKMEQRGELNM